jgi:UDP-N-acetylmuramoyl-tripeptide--D-alanyl-D-alanine ligase
MQAALRLLKKMPGKKLAVLGSMLELGTDSPKYHKETGALARTYADKIIGVGEEAKDYQADVWYKNSDEAASHVLEDIGENVSILVKGSRGVHMEKIVDVIKEHYS